jgi:hypothetical protein
MSETNAPRVKIDEDGELVPDEESIAGAKLEEVWETADDVSPI